VGGWRGREEREERDRAAIGGSFFSPRRGGSSALATAKYRIIAKIARRIRIIQISRIKFASQRLRPSPRCR
jgi:hypothetical protein